METLSIKQTNERPYNVTTMSGVSGKYLWKLQAIISVYLHHRELLNCVGD
jgi:predicted secreted protein